MLDWVRNRDVHNSKQQHTTVVTVRLDETKSWMGNFFLASWTADFRK